jgi:hypothetical protein
VPSSRPERVLAFSGVLLAAALAVLVGIAWAQYHDAEPPTLRGAAAEAFSEAPVESVPDFAPLSTGREVAPSAADNVARLTVVASRGPCWLEVRRGGSAGPISFVGLLARGDRRTLRGKVLWLTVGAGQNVDLRLNGEVVSNVPAGVSTLTAQRGKVAASTPG